MKKTLYLPTVPKCF